jgi:hypothetical protein
MAQVFSCPSCSAPLDYEGTGEPTLRCPYCSNSVVVPQEMRHQKAEKVPSHTTMALMGQAANLKELARLVRSGQAAQAIQLYQYIFKVSPQDAAHAVGEMSSGQAVVVTSQSFPMVVGTHSSSASYISSQPNVPVVTVTSTSVNTRGQRNLVWVIGCFVAFIIITTVLPTILGAIIAVVVPILAVIGEVLLR